MNVWIRHASEANGSLLGDFSPSEVEALLRIVATPGVEAYTGNDSMSGPPLVQVCAELHPGIELIYGAEDD